MNRSKIVRRCAGTALAVGVTAGMGIAVSPAVLAAPSDTAATTDATAGDAVADLTLPEDSEVNMAVNGVTNDGAPIVSFLQDALNLASEFMQVDTSTGVISLLESLLGELPDSTLGSFDAVSLPDFLKQEDNGVVTGDTTGVKPGKYTIEGTLTDPSGREIPVELTLSIGGSDSSGSTDGDSDSTTSPSGSETTSPSTSQAGSTETSGSASPTETDGSSNPTETDGSTSPTDTTDGEDTKTGVTYEDAEVAAGEKQTVSPSGAKEGMTFVSTGNPDWVQVDPKTGEVTLTPTNGTSAGDNEITVGYTDKSVDDLIASAGKSKPDMETTTFTAKVTRDDSSDATAESPQTDTGADSGTADTDSGATNTDSGATDAGGGATDAGTSGGEASMNADSNAATANQADNSSTQRAGQKPTYVQTAGQETLPVTGVNAQGLTFAAIVAFIVGAAALMMGTRRAR